MTAAAELARADAQVLVLEARTRVGGRMFTQRDPATGTAVELGAEFIHGRPPEIFDRLERNGILANEVSGSMWRFEGGHLRPANTFAEVDRVMEQMDDTGPDESFLRFVERCCNNPDSADAKDWARRYVTGFHAADPALISVHSLVKEMRAEEAIGGDHSYRMHGLTACMADTPLW